MPARGAMARDISHENDAANPVVDHLQRELAKQRRGLGVRGLLAQYGELITAVMPCVLVSPDSVARFFPAARRHRCAGFASGLSTSGRRP